MSTITQSPAPTPASAPIVKATAASRSWKIPITLGGFAVLSLFLFVLLGRGQRGELSTFRLSQARDVIQLPAVALPTFITGVVVAIVLVLLAALSAWMVYRRIKIPIIYSILFAILFLVGFLAWAASGSTIPVPGLLIGTVTLSAPLIFGALGGVLSERAGVVNVAIEGQLLAGAFSSAVVASATGNPYLGLLAAMVAGALVAMVLAAFSLKYLVDQVIVGVVLNVLVIGLTSFLYSQVLAPSKNLNSPDVFPQLDIPFLSEIPIIGPVLFRQTIIVYVMYFAIAIVYFGLFRTKWGLRVRAVGEHPQAADTVGINVNRTRFVSVTLGGVVSGFGGAYFTLGAVGAFNKEMTNGMGFIALAAVIFGQWHPIKATLAALLFGFATNLQNVLGIIGSPVTTTR